MSYAFERTPTEVFDRTRDIKISRKITVDQYLTTFRYTSPNLSFEFEALPYEEQKSVLREGKLVERRFTVSIDVDEPSLKRSIQFALNKSALPPLSSEEYDEVKSTIRAALIRLTGTNRDGTVRQPELKINFGSRPHPDPSKPY